MTLLANFGIPHIARKPSTSRGSMSSKHLSRPFAFVVTAFISVGSAQADSASALFTDRVGHGDIPGAFATLSLSDDGSIFATVTSLTSLKVRGFGFDSDVRYSTHDFSSPDVFDSGWGTSFGIFESGWVHLPGSATQSLSWTIGTLGSFSSVFELFRGNGSAFDAYVNAEATEHDFTEYAANFSASPVPEPATLPVLMAGLSLVGLASRSHRRRKRPRNPNFDHPCRLNNDQEREAAMQAAVLG